MDQEGFLKQISIRTPPALARYLPLFLTHIFFAVVALNHVQDSSSKEQ